MTKCSCDPWAVGLALMGLSLAASAAPPISGELGFGPARRGDAQGVQRGPSVAFDGANFLLVFADERSGTRQISGARFNVAREVRDPFSFPISTGDVRKDRPRVAAGGAGFLVVWEEERNGSFGVYGTRISGSGQVLDPAGLLISDTSGDQRRPSVAWNGTSYLVVWQDSRADGVGFDLYGARVDPAGTVLDPMGIPISAAPGDQLEPAVVSLGGSYLAAWADLRDGTSKDVFAARISSDGTVQDGSGIPVAQTTRDEGVPALAFNGTHVLVAWEDLRTASTRDVLAIRLTTSGALVDAGPIVISAQAREERGIAIATDGTDFMVSFAEHMDFRWVRIGADGAVLATTGAVYTYMTLPGTSVAFGGGHYVIASERGGNSINLRTIAPDGQDLGEVLASGGAAVHEGPAVAWNGSVYLVVWKENTGEGGTRTVHAARVAPDGTVLDPGGILLDNNWYIDFPSVASNGSEFLVVWRRDPPQQTQVWGARLDSAGNVLDSSKIVIASNASMKAEPAVASDGSGYLVTWRDERAGRHIYGARVTAGGSVQDPDGFPIAITAGSKDAPAVGWDGTQYVVAWEDENGCTGCSNVRATRVAQSGQVLDPDGIAITNGSGFRRDVTVSGDGTQSLIAWSDNRSGLFDIYATRMTPTGAIETPGGFPVSTAASDQHAPSLAFDGSVFWAVWQDGQYGPSMNLTAARISTTGEVLDPSDETQAGVLVSAEAHDEGAPALASGGGAQAVVVYTRYLPSPQVGGNQVRARLFGQLSPVGAVCTTGGECASGFCADGVCCESACGGAEADCQVCSVAAGGSVDGQCTIASQGAVCRSARGSCDLVETCDGASFTCPADEVVADGEVCGAAGEGTCGAGRCSTEAARPPRFLSEPPGRASCGIAWRYGPEGAPQLEGDGPFRFSLRPAGDAPIPAGVFLNTQTGALLWVPSPDQVGSHRFELVAEAASGITAQPIAVDVGCPDDGLLGVGCGCNGAGSAFGALALATAALGLVRRRRPFGQATR